VQVAPGMGVKIDVAFSTTVPAAYEAQFEVLTEFNRFLVRLCGTAM
jgi:hypothetical protein